MHSGMNRIRMYVLLSLGILASVLMIIISYNGRDLMQKYNVYQMDNFVIVEDSENPEAFYFKEWIYYSDFIKDAYLCTIELGKARSEKEAYLYVDLGALGGWWADPFNNLQRDKEVSNEYVSDELISELKKYVHLDLGIPLEQMTDEVEINELTDSEVKRIAPELFEEVYDDEAVMQWYQEVVRLTPQDNQINMTVRKRFVNDFINFSEGVL